MAQHESSCAVESSVLSPQSSVLSPQSSILSPQLNRIHMRPRVKLPERAWRQALAFAEDAAEVAAVVKSALPRDLIDIQRALQQQPARVAEPDFVNLVDERAA